jgi:hypothetical protein
MRPVSFFLILGVFTVSPASAEPLHIHGRTSYIGEYELSGTVTERYFNGKKEFSGPLTVKHVGLCPSCRNDCLSPPASRTRR